MEQVQKASVEDLARWYRFLPVGDTREQQEIMDSITDRLKKKGGINENGDNRCRRPRIKLVMVASKSF